MKKQTSPKRLEQISKGLNHIRGIKFDFRRGHALLIPKKERRYYRPTKRPKNIKTYKDLDIGRVFNPDFL
jgi:hypothetical protein